MIKYVNPLYFSDSIAAKDYSGIEKQLRNGTKSKKKNIHVIILKENGNNLFEFINMSEYVHLFQGEIPFYVIGVVHNYNDFTTYLQEKVELLLAKGLEINKEQIINLLQGDIL